MSKSRSYSNLDRQEEQFEIVTTGTEAKSTYHFELWILDDLSLLL